MKIIYWFASMLKFCGVENESTKDHTDYMNFFVLTLHICTNLLYFQLLFYFAFFLFMVYTSCYFNFHISLILISA